MILKESKISPSIRKAYGIINALGREPNETLKLCIAETLNNSEKAYNEMLKETQNFILEQDPSKTIVALFKAAKQKQGEK